MCKSISKLQISILIGALFFLAGCQIDTTQNLDQELSRLLKNQAVSFPEEIPSFDPALVALGQALFWDPILSGNQDIACATCHHPSLGTGDGIPLSIGTGGKGLGNERILDEAREIIPRNAPDIFNRGLPEWNTMFWDSRVATIEDLGFDTPAAYRLPEELDSVLAAQALFPLLSRDEMRGNRGDIDIFGEKNALAQINDKYVSDIWAALVERVINIPEYQPLLNSAYPDIPLTGIKIQYLANAIAAYQADAFSFFDSSWDRYLTGDLVALSEEEKQGAILFYGDAKCATCHTGYLLTDQQHYNIGVPQLGPGKGVRNPIDPGRLLESGEAGDRFSFRTPPLHNVTLTGPWMHNGAYDNLEDVIRHHLDPTTALINYDPAQLPGNLQESVQSNDETIQSILAWLSPEVEYPITLSDAEIHALLAFLESLTSPSSIDLSHTVPESVPSGLQVGGQ